VLVAKTALDGHWRGVTVVSQALRDAGFEVVMLGMATVEQIADAALQEDVELVGLNIGGRVEVAERAIAAIWANDPEMPILVGGTIPPAAAARLRARGVGVFPPGSPLDAIVGAAHAAVAERRSRDERSAG
jgi:methylmalonyl-CoA mutase C-terminal domain/subunit